MPLVPDSSALAPPAARTVLVTGAARRLGREISLHFVRAGWDVVAHYRRSRAEALALQAEIARLGRRCHLAEADLAQPDAASALLDQASAAGGGLPHCIVNNASIFEADDACSARAGGMIHHFSTNTATPLLLGNALGARLTRAGAATAGRYSVIHVLDQKVHNLNPDYFSYTVSKLALAHSVALQAQALAPWVRVCGLSPGLMYLSGPQTQGNFDRASQVNLLRQPIAPADVARCALFIAENPSLNGTTLRADNGQHLVALDRDVMFAVKTGPHASPLARDALSPEGAPSALGRPGGVRGAP